jgi:hypothetical protein
VRQSLTWSACLRSPGSRRRGQLIQFCRRNHDPQFAARDKGNPNGEACRHVMSGLWPLKSVHRSAPSLHASPCLCCSLPGTALRWAHGSRRRATQSGNSSVRVWISSALSNCHRALPLRSARAHFRPIRPQRRLSPCRLTCGIARSLSELGDGAVALGHLLMGLSHDRIVRKRPSVSGAMGQHATFRS